jgi:hypothetical protein
MFLLQIIDGGIACCTVHGLELIPFTSTVETIITKYLKEHGSLDEESSEYTTEDGSATLYHLAVDGEVLVFSEEIWAYAFDGSESLSESLQKLRNDWS